MPERPAKKFFRCSACGKRKAVKPDRRGTFRLPRSWKAINDGQVCDGCIKANYVLRAVAFPFHPHGMDWKELDPLLKDCFARATALANWAVLELARHDLARDSGMEKLPPYPKCPCPACAESREAIYLYGHFASYGGRADWDGAAASANAIMRFAKAKYDRERLDVVWRRARALPTFRHPFPFPVDADDWRPHHGKSSAADSNLPLVDVRLPGGRVTLGLRGGPEMARQLAMFRQIVSGEAPVRGELSLYRKRGRVMLKMVALFPRRPAANGAGTLVLKTWPDCFWTAQVEGREFAAWRENGDHVRRQVARHLRYLDRIAEDTKHEKRVPREQRRHIDAAREDRCAKHAGRVKDFIEVATKQAAGYAARQKVGAVLFDYSCREYLPKFPWRQVCETLRRKLDGYGIALVANPGLEEEGESIPA